MKLLQTLVEAAASKSKLTAQTILSNTDQIAKLARGAVATLRQAFGEELMDTPIALITQQVRSYIDATSGTRLNKDDLEMVTNRVMSELHSYLGEAFSDEGSNGQSKVAEDDEDEGGLSESKMAELDDDLKTMSEKDFKKQYGHSKQEMRKKFTGVGKSDKKTVKEAVDTVHGVMAQILDDDLDAYEVMVHPQTPGQRAAAKVIQRMYDQYDSHFADPEQIMLNVHEQIEKQYGPDAGKAPFESVQESEGQRVKITSGPKMYVGKTGTLGKMSAHHAKAHPGHVLVNLDGGGGSIILPKEAVINESVQESEGLEEATRGRPRKTTAATKPAAKKDDSDEDEDTKKVSAKALAKSMENDDDGDEDDDVKKADKASKDAPKKIADTSTKPDQLKDANKKLSKQIQHAVSTSSAKSAFELSKELRATFKNITTDEVKQATAIWKSENQ